MITPEVSKKTKQTMKKTAKQKNPPPTRNSKHVKRNWKLLAIQSAMIALNIYWTDNVVYL